MPPNTESPLTLAEAQKRIAEQQAEIEQLRVDANRYHALLYHIQSNCDRDLEIIICRELGHKHDCNWCIDKESACTCGGIKVAP